MRTLKPNSSPLIPLLLLIAFSLLCISSPVQAQEGESLLLVWTTNEEQDLRGYRIYECDGSGTLGPLVDELLVEDIPWQDRVAGIASFGIDDVQSGDNCWAVTAFDYNLNESHPCLPACITIGTEPPPIHMADFHEDRFYGKYPTKGGFHDTGVEYTFDEKPGELLLTYRVWDVTTPTEVEILLNGNSLGYAAMTGDSAASPLLSIRIPPEYLEAASRNTLRFQWNAAGQDDMWAVGMVEILDLIPLPAPDFYGNLAYVPSGDRSHPRSVGFMFEGSPGAALMHYQVYDVDRKHEVGIFLNGELIGPATHTDNNSYVDGDPLSLPDDLVLDQGVNTLLFSNMLNPPRSLHWGVGDVQISY